MVPAWGRQGFRSILRGRKVPKASQTHLHGPVKEEIQHIRPAARGTVHSAQASPFHWEAKGLTPGSPPSHSPELTSGISRTSVTQLFPLTVQLRNLRVLSSHFLAVRLKVGNFPTVQTWKAGNPHDLPVKHIPMSSSSLSKPPCPSEGSTHFSQCLQNHTNPLYLF